MHIKALVAPELIRPVSDPVQLFQEFAHLGGVDVTVKTEDITEPALAIIPSLLSFKQDQALIYALADTYADRVWGDLLPQIKNEFQGIGEILRGMQKGNLPHKLVKKTVAEIVQERNIENDELALGVQRIFEAWHLRYSVVQEHTPLSLWPPVFSDRDFQESPHSFIPILQYTRKRYWKLGHEKDTWPDSPKIFRGRDWESVLGDVFLTYRDWYRSDQERLFNHRFTINPLKRYLYDEIWAGTLMTEGELKFGRAQLLIYPPSPVIKIVIDKTNFTVDGLTTYPPDVVRAVIEYSGEQPPIPANPTESYLKMLANDQGTGHLTQDGLIYRVNLSRRILKFFQGYPTRLEVRWLDDTHAVVSGDKSPLEAQLVVGSKVHLMIGSKLRAWVEWPDQDMTNDEARRLISLWGMWMWQMTTVGAGIRRKHPKPPGV